jgi:RNA polymerase sigma-70 factor (ECF subfamily)
MPRRSFSAADQPPPAAPSPVVGERARLEAMFDAHHNLVWRTLCRIGLDAETAADVTQQAFVVAIERISAIWPGSERGFLIGCALRIARKQRRSVARMRPEGQLDERVRAPGSAEHRALTLQLLDRTLEQLDAGLVEVFVLFDIEGLTRAEIARALDIPEGTVASRLRRAREEFRAVAKRFELVFAREEGAR